MKKRIEYKEINYDPNEPLRLNKFLANAGICSRREADEFIQAGVVSLTAR
jgi:23S rRNA pseudouridine2605 synthase